MCVGERAGYWVCVRASGYVCERVSERYWMCEMMG